MTAFVSACPSAHNAPGFPRPSSLHLVATRADGPDRAAVALRADVSDLTLAGARRHAVVVIDALVARWPGAEVDVQLLVGAGVPLFLVTSCGAAAGGVS